MATSKLKDLKILVFGAAGQVGQSIYNRLKDEKNVVFSERNADAPMIRVCDLVEATGVESLIAEVHPDVIINCAAYTAVDQAEKEMDIAMAVNGTALGVIAKAAEKIHATLIHYSTDYVYDGMGTSPHREDERPNPVNAYGASKLAGENAALEHCSKAYIFRTQWVYNQGGKNFVNTMLRLGRERDELSVVGDQIGAPTSSDVIADYTILALEKIGTPALPPGIYHLACRGEISWHDFAEEIFRIARERGDDLKVKQIKKIATKDFPTPAKRPLNSRLALGKLEEALQRPLPDWKDALRRVMGDHPVF